MDGAFNQKPILTAGAVMLLALVLLAVGGGVAWALTSASRRPEATFQELGPPEPPKEVKVEPIGPDSVEVQWEAVPNVEGYTIVQVLDDGLDRRGSQPVAGHRHGQDRSAELTPATNVCFAVQSRRGDLAEPVHREGLWRDTGRATDRQSVADGLRRGTVIARRPRRARGAARPTGPVVAAWYPPPPTAGQSSPPTTRAVELDAATHGWHLDR